MERNELKINRVVEKISILKTEIGAEGDQVLCCQTFFTLTETFGKRRQSVSVVVRKRGYVGLNGWWQFGTKEIYMWSLWTCSKGRILKVLSLNRSKIV